MLVASLTTRADAPTPVKPDVEISCIRRDASCDVIRWADDRRATLPPADVLTYLAEELRLPSKSKLRLVALVGNFSKLKSQMQAAGYLVVNSVEVGLKDRESER